MRVFKPNLQTPSEKRVFSGNYFPQLGKFQRIVRRQLAMTLANATRWPIGYCVLVSTTALDHLTAPSAAVLYMFLANGL
jgi:hypothetical protein